MADGTTPAGLPAVLDALHDGLLVADPEGHVLYANTAATELLGWSRLELTSLVLADLIPERYRAGHFESLHAIQERGHHELLGVPLRLPTLHRDGAEVQVEMVFATTMSDGQLRIVGTLHDVSERAEERRARAAAEAAHQRLEFVLAAHAHVATAIDYGDVLERLARLAVPMLGDLCVIDILDERGAVLRREMVAHADPELENLIRQALQGFTIDMGSTHPVAEVVRSGRPELIADLTEERIRAGLRDEEMVKAALNLGLSSQLTVPLLSRGRVLGALSLVNIGRRGRYDDDDLLLAEELGRQAGLAIDNGRIYRRERTVGETLQRAFMPDSVPEIGGFELTALFEPANSGEIGGDWYDVFPLGNDRMAFVIGDVGGKGLRAAAVMAQLRNGARALMVAGMAPGAVCNHLDALMCNLELGEFATMIVGTLSPASGTVTFASAGHLPALYVAHRSATAMISSGAGSPLGTGTADRSEVGLVLHPGETFIVFTDGLVERRGRPVDEGIYVLCRLIDAVEDQRLEDMAERLLKGRLAGGPNPDDIALLAIRRNPA